MRDTALLRTACSRNPAGIRTPRIFLTENGYVLMSVRVSRVKALLQASLVVLFTLRDTTDCSALRAPAILTGIRTPRIFLTENGYVLMSVRVSRIKALLQANLVGLLTLRDTADCSALRAPAILAGIRTPRIFLTENGCVLMSVRISKLQALLQASLTSALALIS